VADTIKQVRDGVVVQTLPRSELAAVQTPQGFPTALLRSVHEKADRDFTDDAALLEASGHPIRVVPGEAAGRKLTTPADLNAIADRRVGVGMDSHRYGDSGALQLGCLEWQGFPQLLGHSDGDAAAHALVDALLSAAGLGDIGSQFGVDRPDYAGATGERFLVEASKLLAERGWRLENASLQLMADLPKIAPRRLQLEERLSAILEAPVAVAATTTDGLGFLSDARGVGAVATALVRRQS
jgi:2-C-methyl-D-erythritol 4-phosphate cytidylyltransferase/2-C-methyl-D-erythritol 2,4-cyclodiphosphate synthase